MTDKQAPALDATLPPPTEAETGIALEGADAKWPHNHRLRAEALAAAGIETDPDGLITDDLIADAGARVARNDKAEKAEADRIEAEAKAAEKEQAAADKDAAKLADAEAKAIAQANEQTAATAAAAAPGAAATEGA